MNSVRIIGGAWRSRRIHFADIPELRPTQDRIRETLFNWLAPYIEGCRCLDLFAGSGILSFEVLSRGGAFACLVDSHPQVLRALQDNMERLSISADQIAIIRGKFPQSVPPLPGTPFNIIFLDPPFHKNLILPSIQWLRDHEYIAPNSSIYIEMEKKAILELPTHWQIHRQKKTASLIYQLIKIEK